MKKHLTVLQTDMHKSSPPAASSSSTCLEDVVLPAAGDIKSLMDLMPFFQAVEQRRSNGHKVDEEVIVSSVENLMERDFLESIPV